MPQVQRSSDVVEQHSEKVITYGSGGLVLLLISAFLYYYRGSSGMFVPLSNLLAFFGFMLVGYAVYCGLQVRKVTTHDVACPYCEYTNFLTESPKEDFTCVSCHRLIPVVDGSVIPVSQVRCGFCNSLNYYSEKTDVLLCEECNHEIPIAHDEGHVPKKKIAAGFAVQDDDRTYMLTLTEPGNRTEEVIGCLQHMLALNRNQVKQILENAPVTLLTGIPKKKAEMLRAQLAIYDAESDITAME